MLRTAVDLEDVVTVRVTVEASIPAGVTVGGAKLHEAPVGSPEQPNDIAEVNPFAGVI